LCVTIKYNENLQQKILALPEYHKDFTNKISHDDEL